MKIRLIVCLVVVLGFGCRARVLAPSDADEDRATLGELKAKVEALEARNRELEAVAAATAARQEGGIDAEVLAAIPALASVQIDRLSGGVDDDGDGVVDTVVVYVWPEDSRGRFLQVAGELGVTVTAVTGGEPARTLGMMKVGPRELRDAYRSSWLGIHYVVRVPVKGVEEKMTVSVELKDGLSGTVAKATREVRGTP
jgi:hypothetical protein